jgi:hypothetical protein
MRAIQAGDRISLSSETAFDVDPIEHFDRKSKCPKKTFSIALGMSVIGLVLLILGIKDVAGMQRDRTHWLVFMLIGALLFTPGIYVSTRIIQAWRGVEGYSFEDIPTHENHVLP